MIPYSNLVPRSPTAKVKNRVRSGYEINPILDPNALIYIPHPRVNCLKTIPFKAAHTYIAHIWQYPTPPAFG